LPPFSIAIVHLDCGDGALLRAAANESTQWLLGCDSPLPANCFPIAPLSIIPISIIPQSSATLYPLLHTAGFTADLFIVGPVPGSEACHRLTCVLDLCSDYGEGVMLVYGRINHLFSHPSIWAVNEHETNHALYFAKAHTGGWEHGRPPDRLMYRGGIEVRPYPYTVDTAAQWEHVCAALNAQSPRSKVQSLVFSPDSGLQPVLNAFEEHGLAVDRDGAQRLFQKGVRLLKPCADPEDLYTAALLEELETRNGKLGTLLRNLHPPCGKAGCEVCAGLE
jgi:hypothetical protein